MAEVVLRDQVARAGLAGQIVVDSAGTGDWHVGGPMEQQARTQLAQRGYDGEAHQARQFDRDWLPERDLLEEGMARLVERLQGLLATTA